MTPLDYISGSSIIPKKAFGISPSQIYKFFDKPHEWYRSEMLGEKQFLGNTSSYLGTVVHFIANEFSKTKTVRKYFIYQYLFEQLVPKSIQNNLIASNQQFVFDEHLDIEEMEDYLKDNTDPEFVDVEYIFNNYKPMGNALIQFLRSSGIPQESEVLIAQEILENFYACGSTDAIKHKRKVVDYKSTSDLTAKKTIPYNYKLQLLTYAWILKKRGYPIDTISIVWITHNQVNRISSDTGKPMKDYPTTVSEVSEIIDQQDFDFIESILKLISESVQATYDYPHLAHIIWKDYRLK